MANERTPPKRPTDTNKVLAKALGITAASTPALPTRTEALVSALRAGGSASTSPAAFDANTDPSNPINQGLGGLPGADEVKKILNPGAADPNNPLHNPLHHGILSLLQVQQLQQEQQKKEKEYQAAIINTLRNKTEKWSSEFLHKKIRAARMVAGYKTQKAFAERLQVSHGAVSQWESEEKDKRTVPDMHWILRISLATGVPPGWLIDDQYRDLRDAETVRTLNLANRWHTMPVQMEGELPANWPENGPKFESATVVDGLGALLHDSNDFTDPSEKRRHPRPVEIAFRAVEVNVAQQDETLFDHFSRRISDYYHADYFDGINLVAFIQFGDRANLLSLRRQIADMLLAEALLGKPLRKMVLAWGAAEQAPETLQRAQALCSQINVHLAYFSHAAHGAEEMLAFVRAQAQNEG